MVVRERDDAQAVLLVRALCDVLHEMTQRLAWLESRDATGSWERAIRLEAAPLRRDISEARRHIDRQNAVTWAASIRPNRVLLDDVRLGEIIS